MVGTIALAKADHLKTDLKKVWISNGLISDPHWLKYFFHVPRVWSRNVNETGFKTAKPLSL